MPRVSRVVKSIVRRLVYHGWGLVPLTIGAFIWLHQTPGYAALAARQVVFLFPPVAALVNCIRIVRIAPDPDDRRAWGMLGVTMGLLVASEGFYSAYQLLVAPAGPPVPSAYDVLNLAAGAVLVAAIVLATGFRRLGSMAQLRIACDTIAIGVVAFVGTYALWDAVLGPSQLPWVTVAWSAGYSFIGVAVFVGVVWLAVRARAGYPLDVVVPLAAALIIFALGVAVWPLWPATGASDQNTLSGAASSTLLLFGYALMMMSTMRRVASVKKGWIAPVRRGSDLELRGLSTFITATVLIGALGMGIRAYTSTESRQEMVFLIGAASVAIMALVARTGIATAEMGTLRGNTATDPVSGALNHRAFQEMCERRVHAARRKGIPFALAVLDLDGFERVNALLGHAAGDHALHAVSDALALAGGRGVRVFRMSADEFGVIGVGVTRSHANSFGTSLLAAVAGIEPAPGLRLSASVGVVTTEDGSESRDELIGRADAAQVWAKYHGKGRVVVYDPGIVRALGVEERLRLHEEQSYLGVARALAAAADSRDPNHRYHSRNVAALAVLLAEESGFDARAVRAVEIAAMLHDVGRIAMPDDVTFAYRSGEQDPESQREHASLGQQLVESIGVEGMGAWVRAHHEWWDGTGYPDGLAGAVIPVQARIIALADAYDGMTTGRRGGFRLSKRAALQEIDHGIGTRFDPELAERFIEIVGRTISLGWSDGGLAS